MQHDSEELDALIKRFRVDRRVIDGLPERHATRQFAMRHAGQVALSFFNENQRGAPKWTHAECKVESNRTEALDASRAAIRERRVVLPRREPLVETFVRHLSAIAKRLEENPDTGARKCRHIETAVQDHFAFASTCAWLACQDYSGGRGLLEYCRHQLRKLRAAPPMEAPF